MTTHPRRRLGVWIGSLGLAAGGFFVLPSASANGSANLNPSTAPNTATAAKIAITTAGTHEPGATVVHVSGPGDGGGAFEDLNPSVSGQTVTATINFVRFGVPAGPGNYTVKVCDAAATCDGSPNTESFSPFVVTGDAPSVSAVTPIAVGAGIPATKPLAMTLTGSGFAVGATVTVTDPHRGDSGGVTLKNIKVPSPTTITAELSTSTGATPGPRVITVTNTDGQASTLKNRFVVDPAPSVITPQSLFMGQGATDLRITLRGTGIQPGAVATVVMPSAPADPVTIPFPSNGVTLRQGQHDSTRLPLWFTVTSSATTGRPRSLVVTNPDGGSATIPVTVTPAPTFAEQDTAAPATRAQTFTPLSIGQGAHGVSIKISGSGFVPGAKVDFGPGTSHGAVTVSSDGKTATVAGVTVAADAPVGNHKTEFINGDGGVPVLKPGLNINATNVTAVQPASLRHGISGEFISLIGAGYNEKTKVTIPGVTVNKVSYTGTTDPLKLNVDVPKKAAPGLRDVTMTDEDGGVAVCHRCFSIDDFKVTKVKPGTAANTGATTVTIRGKHIPSQVRAEFTPSSGILGQPVVFATHSRVTHHGRVYTGRVDLRGAAPGEYDVRLTGSKDVGTCACTLTVTADAPQLTAVDPAIDMAPGDKAVPVELTGQHFSRGMVVTFPSTAGVTVLNQVADYVSPTKLVEWVDLNGVALSTVQFDVTLTAADKQTVTCTKCLTVHPVPKLAKMSPAALPQGADKARITIVGSDFVPGSTLDLGAGVVIEGKPVVTSTAIRATVDVGAYVRSGELIRIAVTGPNGATGSCGDCFRVAPASPQPGAFFSLPRTQVFIGKTRGERIQVAGTDGIPFDADAALLDVNVEGAGRPTTVSIAPAGQSDAQRVMDVPAGGAAEQTVTATLGDGGSVGLRLSPAPALVRVAVVGYYRHGVGGAAFTAVSPNRLLDRAVGHGTTTVQLPSGGAQPSGARAAVVQLAVTDATREARLTVAPSDGELVGGLQLMPGGGANGLFRVAAGDQPTVQLSLSGGAAHATLTLVGWYVAGAGPTFTPMPPSNLYTPYGGSRVNALQGVRVSLTDSGDIPVNASAALVTVTATDPSMTALLTVASGDGSSTGARIPVTSGRTTTGFVVVPLDDTGSLSLSVSAGQTEIDIESIGYFR